MAPIAPARVIDVLAQVFKAHIVGLQDTSGIEGNGSDVVGVNDADDEVTGVVCADARLHVRSSGRLCTRVNAAVLVDDHDNWHVCRI